MGNTQKIKMALAILLLSQMMVFGQTAIPLVYDKEYTNDNFQLPGILPIDKLPEIATLLHGLMEAGVQQISRIGRGIVLR